jgi:hypothetical protein
MVKSISKSKSEVLVNTLNIRTSYLLPTMKTVITIYLEYLC